MNESHNFPYISALYNSSCLRCMCFTGHELPRRKFSAEWLVAESKRREHLTPVLREKRDVRQLG